MNSLRRIELDYRLREALQRKATIEEAINDLQKRALDQMTLANPNESLAASLRRGRAEFVDELELVDLQIQALEDAISKRTAGAPTAAARIAELEALATTLRAHAQSCLDRIDAAIAEADASITAAADPYTELRPILREIAALRDEFGIDGDSSGAPDPCLSVMSPTTCALESRSTRLQSASIRVAELRALR